MARRRLPRWLAKALVFVGILAGLVLLWEAYKMVGKATGGRVPFTGWGLPVRPDDTSMPHVADIVGALFRPVSRAADADLDRLQLADPAVADVLGRLLELAADVHRRSVRGGDEGPHRPVRSRIERRVDHAPQRGERGVAPLVEREVGLAVPDPVAPQRVGPLERAGQGQRGGRVPSIHGCLIR